jgi:hypothetical protein
MMPSSLRRLLVTAAVSALLVAAPLFTVELRAAIITNLVNYWSMDDASGATEDDEHGAVDLTDNGTVGSAAGCVGNGRTFNGSSQYLQSGLGTVPFDGTAGPWTFQVWVKSAATTQTNTYLAASSGNAGADQSAVIYEFVDDTVEFFAANHTGTDPRTNSGVSVADTNCHHIVYRKNASGASGWDKFLDGTKTQISASIDFTLSSGVDAFALGAAVGGTNHFSGTLDEVGWWDTNLSDAEVAWLYNSGSGRSYTDIVNETSGAAPCDPARFLLLGVGGC